METAEPQHRDRGFTLIELLIVIVILGILSAVVVLSVSSITDRGQDNACQADEKTLRVAYEASVANTGAGLDEAGLVSGGYLNAASSLHDIDAAGTITAAGACVAPTTVAPTTT